MLVNVPESISSAAKVQGGSLENRPIYVEQFADGSGFVFNAQNPSGVKYLSKDAFTTYAELIEKVGGAQPCVDVEQGPYNADLVKHGIAIDARGNSERDRVAAKAKDRLFTVWFHISNACNLACSYCYIPKLEKAVDVKTMSRHFMSMSTIETATHNLFKFCAENRFAHLQIKFAGGEPTLDVERINITCDIARTLADVYPVKVSFAILTNGVFVDKSIFTTLKKYGFLVSISMDGGRNHHNETRFTIPRSRIDIGVDGGRKAGSWDTIVDNIDELISQGMKPFILCTVTEKNYNNLMELVEYTVLKKIGFRLSLVRDRHTYKKDNIENDMLSELIKVYTWLGDNMPVDMPIERYARFAEWRPDVKKQSVCGTCRNTMAITQDGRVASCQMRMDKPHGSALDESLTSIFDRMRAAEDNIYLASPQAKTGDCSVCYWKFTCAGGCPEHTRMAMGTANSPSPWCHLYQEFLPHYLRAIATQIKARVDQP